MRLALLPATIIATFLTFGCQHMEREMPVEQYPWQSGPREVLQEPLAGYWPRQEAPKAFRRIVTPTSSFTPEEGESAHALSEVHNVLATSLAGIAARAVNEGRHDELLWLETDRRIYDEWLHETVSRNSLQERPKVELFDLISVYQALGLVRGYVVYRADSSVGRNYTAREQIDTSINAATTLAAGHVGALIVEENLEEQVRSLGLPRFADAREMSEEEAFEQVQASLSRSSMLTIDPRAPNLRDMAIAHRLATVYGTDDFFLRLVEWVEPNSVILGWNSGDEGRHTQPPSRFGLVQSASNWAINIPIISAGAHRYRSTSLPRPELKLPVDTDSPRQMVSFLMSDGDNVQYLMGGFFDRPGYWGAQSRGDFPVGWSICGAKLAQVSPGVLNKISASSTPNDSFIEFSGGYFYPDFFGKSRENSRELLEKHADMLALRMRETGTRVLTFICKDVGSEASMEAYQVFADRIPGLLGMIAVQYYPYNGGHGEVFWVETAQGERIPVLTPHFCIWEHANWKGGGTPARIARHVNDYSSQANEESRSAYSMVSVHIWSVFQRIDGNDEEAENVPRPEGRRRGPGERGLYSIKRTIQRLDPSIHVVTPEEMIIHLRAEDARTHSR